MRLSRIVNYKVSFITEEYFLFFWYPQSVSLNLQLQSVFSQLYYSRLNWFNLNWSGTIKDVFIFGVFKTYLLAPLVLWLCCSLKRLSKSSDIAGRLVLFTWSETSIVTILVRSLVSVYRGALGCLSSLKFINLRALF